jgi:hypothetical protein
VKPTPGVTDAEADEIFYRTGVQLFLYVDLIHLMGWTTPRGSLPYLDGLVDKSAVFDLVRWSLGDTSVPLAQRRPGSGGDAARVLDHLTNPGRMAS